MVESIELEEDGRTSENIESQREKVRLVKNLLKQVKRKEFPNEGDKLNFLYFRMRDIFSRKLDQSLLPNQLQKYHFKVRILLNKKVLEVLRAFNAVKMAHEGKDKLKTKLLNLRKVLQDLRIQNQKHLLEKQQSQKNIAILQGKVEQSN